MSESFPGSVPPHLVVGIDLNPPSLGTNPALTWQELVASAENSGVGFATFSDPPRTVQSLETGGYRIGAIERAGAVAATTSTLGLIPEIAVTYAEPFHVATQIASLDFASRGRAGWLAADAPEETDQYGVFPPRSGEETDTNRRDAISVAGLLWDSWEDNALLRDRGTGQYIDRSKVHYTNFDGAHFSVKGPSIIPRPPQGRPVVFGRHADPGVDVLITSDLESAATTGIATIGETPLTIVDIAWDGAQAGELTAAVLRHVGAVAGVRLQAANPDVLSDLIAVLAHETLPALLRADAYRRPFPGQSLRTHFSLERPTSVFETERIRSAQ